MNDPQQNNDQQHETPSAADEQSPDSASTAGAAAAGPQGVPPADSQDVDVASLQAEMAEQRDRLLRMQAEMENLRRRTSREIDEERRYANLPLMRDLLPVLDNVGRAVEAAEKSHDIDNLLAGIKLISQQLEAILAQYNCKPIEAQGQEFDPAVHQAILQQPSPGHPPNTVVMVTQGGYQLHDRVVRHSQVIVSK